MVRPPSVVSKAKLNRSAMARSSSRFPWSQAALFASACAITGLADRILPAASSGLKYSGRFARNMAPATLLFPAPFVPASQ
jgi:hypothetical protein